LSVFFAVILCVVTTTAQIARATIAVEGPVFIRPGAETALKVLTIGTELKVLQQETGWAQVEFTDSQFGRRVGWVETRLIRTTVEDAARRGAPRVEATVVADRPLSSTPARGPVGEAAPESIAPPAKLTVLFNEAKIKNPHIIVERIVKEIDQGVRKVRFPEWQSSKEGERLVRDELGKVLLKYQVQRDLQLIDRAFALVRQYY
jgi:hypothetical protein